MKQRQSSWIRYIFSSNYKWISTLITILIPGLAIYFFLPQSFLAALQSEEQSSPPILAKGVLLQDDFSDPNSGWPSDSQANSSFGYQPPFYYLEVNAPNNSVTAFRGLNLANFTAEAKVVANYTNTLNGNFRMGLAIRRSGEHYYAFTISPRTQTAQVLKHSSSTMEVLAEDKYGSTWATYQVYTLTVTAQDTNFSFHINDQPVIKITDPDYTDGDVGFIAETFDESSAHIIYISFLIKEIDGAVVAVRPSVTVAISSTPHLSSMPTTTSIVLTPILTPGLLPATTPTFLISTPTPFPTVTLLPSTPTSTSSPSPTATSVPPTPMPSASPTTMSAPFTPTPSPTLTSSPIPAATPISPSATPGSIPTASPTPTTTASLPAGTFVLLKPLDVNQPSFGPTDFEWEWTGLVPPGFGFEVRVWREDEPVAGVHNAVEDNLNGNIKSMGQNKYTLSVNIRDAAGIRGRSGEYLWTVALVQVIPSYADQGRQASPARLRFEAGGGGGSGGGNDSGGGGGGGVGID
ncbi:MAG: hypothetical protein HYR94_20430 [Chloroflexi bacterium]|nr:hypothetical protein [Chloroflexota bacterium]